VSQSSQQAVQYLDNLIGKLYQALRIKFSDILDAFDTVLPDPRVVLMGIISFPYQQVLSNRLFNIHGRISIERMC